MPEEGSPGEKKLRSFKEYLRQYSILKDVFGCRDATPIIMRAEILNSVTGPPIVETSEGEMLTEIAAMQVIIKSSIIDQAVWSWWIGEHCPDFTDRKITLMRAEVYATNPGFTAICFERKRNSRPELEVWECVGEGQTVVEAVYGATVAHQFGEEGEACRGEENPN